MNAIQKCKVCGKIINYQEEEFCYSCLVELWGLAQQQAIKEYEENFGSWEDADKYEREDYVWGAYEKLMRQS